MTIKEIQVRYLRGPCFKNIYSYLAQNKLPSSKAVIRQIEMQAEKL